MNRQSRRLRAGRPFAIVLTTLFLLALISLAAHWLRDVRPTPQAELLARELERVVDEQCRNVHNARNQCAFIKTNCPDEEIGIFSYLRLYYCQLPNAKPLGFLIIALWAALLFSTIGIAASEFFCVNISTISNILGMSESLTGVTFLALGNGSPDVFSTFAAVNSHSGSMAIGELIGAASFICAVVAGSMAIVRPFKVARKSFVRDICFFIVAITFSMVFLANGSLALWECVVMVAFYVFYVVVVVCWHSWLSRRRRKREREAAARSHFIPAGEDTEQYHDDDEEIGPLARTNISEEDFNNLEQADYFGNFGGLNDDDDDEERDKVLGELNSNMRVTRPLDSERRSAFNPIRPSLVGALEFRSALASFQLGSNQNISLHLRRFSDAAFLEESQRVWGPASGPQVGHDGHLDGVERLDGANGTSLDLSRAVADTSHRVRAASVSGAAGLQLDPSVYQDSFLPKLDVLAASPLSSPTLGTASDSRYLQSPQASGSGQMSPLLSISPPPELALRETTTASCGGEDGSSHPTLLIPSTAHLRPHHHTPLTASPQDTKRFTRPRATSHRSLRLILPPATSPRLSPKRTPTHTPYDGRSNGETSVPIISAVTQSGDSANNSETAPAPWRWWPHRFIPSPDVLCRVLFPTLYGWRKKSLAGKLIGLVSAPSFFLLTITLPVVEAGAEVEDTHNVKPNEPSFPDNAPVQVGVETPLINGNQATQLNTQSRDPVLDTKQEQPITTDEWNRWLVCIQCFASPLFMVLMFWISSEGTVHDLLKPVLFTLLGSLIALFFILTFTTPDRVPKGHYLLCFVGFAVSITWISTIAGEVVGVLKTIGVIFNMSDAILGLTVFAVGNSLGDLVADITVARLGYPVMALAACFGGPLLNILLGIGLSGIYVMVSGAQKRKHRHPDNPIRYKPYHIQVSTTLLISAVALLITLVGLLIVVPLNGWRMDRKIGWGLIGIWVVSTIINVVVEVAGLADDFPSWAIGP